MPLLLLLSIYWLSESRVTFSHFHSISILKRQKKKYSDFNNWWGQKSHSYFTTIFRGSLLKKLWFWWIHTDDSHILCPDRVHGESSVATGELHLLKELQALTAVQPLSGRHICVSASTTVSLCSVTGAVDSKVSTLTSSVGKQRMWQRERGLGTQGHYAPPEISGTHCPQLSL